MTDPRTLKEGSGSVLTEKFNAIVDVILSGLRVTASNVDSGAAQDGDVLTANGAGGASWEPGGGSQPLLVFRVPVAFNTPDILTGIDVGYTTSVDDVVYVGGYITTAFDGSTPRLRTFCAGEDPDDDRLEQSVNANGTTDTQTGTGSAWVMGNPPLSNGYANRISAAKALKIALTDGSGGDPGSMQGEGEIVIAVIPASD